MPRPQYGWEHQQARARALAALVPGEACPYCRLPMSADMLLDFDHFPPLAIPYDGQRLRRLTHRSCNRRAGQAVGVAMRRRNKGRTLNSQGW